jgi:hypothetical protein
MKDEKGIYYYPELQEKNLRMYVRKNGNDIEFRMWDSKNPEVWKNHIWLDMASLKKAADIYSSHPNYKGRSPLHLYDLQIAQQLVSEEETMSGEDS